MGKSKRSKLLRKEALRVNPVGIPSIRSLDQWEAEANSIGSIDNTKSGYVQNLLEQVESRVTEERDNGLNALAAAAENPEILQEVLSTNILSIAAALLLDESVTVRNSAAGSLRNLSGVSGSICDAMVSRDVMKSLVSLLKQKYGIDWSPRKSKALTDGSFKTDCATDAFVQALHLLSNLCAASEKALKIFNDEGLFLILPKSLDVAKFGLPVALAGARCLQTVTEENRDSLPNIPDLVPLLLTILREPEDKGADWIHLKTLIVGTLINLLGSEIGVKDGGVLSLVFRTLGHVLEHNETQAIKTFSSEVPLQQEVMDTGKRGAGERECEEEVGPVRRTQLEASASKIFSLLESETLAMEILSNLVFVEDEDGGGPSEFSDDSEEEPMEEDCALEKLTSAVVDFNGDVSQGVRDEGLIAKVLSKCKGLPLNVSEILENNSEYGKEILQKVGHMRSVGLLCLQNLLQTFDLQTMGGTEQIIEIYKTLSKTLPAITSMSAEKRLGGGLDLLEALISGLRAVLQKAIDENCDGVVENFTSQDLEGLLKLYCLRDDNLRMATTLVRLVGSFGILVSRGKTLSAESRLLLLRIGEFLIGCLTFGSDKVDLIRTAEALDTIFDVFAEDDFNDVIQELGLIEKLRNLEPHFRKQIRNRRRLLGESRGVVETAKTNLSRFIEYKRGLGC